MNIKDFFSGYKNHPILFVGAGFSMRYLQGAYSWPNLLRQVVVDLNGNDELFLDLRNKYNHLSFGVDYSEVAQEIESIFNDALMADRNGDFKSVNDEFYENSSDGDYSASRFKIYISRLVNIIESKGIDEEIDALVKASRNIGSVITTNYDRFIEGTLGFHTVIGNEILLSNPYGSVYKIHGCVTRPSSIIITGKDYHYFDSKYDLIRAQLLSLFIHNPIIFLGYSISDANIKKVLKTIFSYVSKDSEVADKIRNNFLLVERDENSMSLDVVAHDIDIEDIGIIKINKIRTDNFLDIYRELGDVNLPVSVMDIRKVESVFGKIKEGGDIKVKIVGDIDALSNDELVLAVGSVKVIKYHFQTIVEMMENYFDIISNGKKEIVELVEKQIVSSTQYFTAYGFDKICPDLKNMAKHKLNQKKKLESYVLRISARNKVVCNSIEDVYSVSLAVNSRINDILFYNTYEGNITLDDLKNYLLSFADKKCTEYKRLLSLYDYLTNKN